MQTEDRLARCMVVGMVIGLPLGVALDQLPLGLLLGLGLGAAVGAGLDADDRRRPSDRGGGTAGDGDRET